MVAKRVPILLVLMTLLPVSCNQSRFKGSLPQSESILTTEVKNCAVTYSEHIAPLMERSCIKCHSDGGLAGFRPLNSFSSVVALRTRILDQVRAKAMPPIDQGQAFNSDEIRLLESWIESGHPENKDSCTTTSAIATVPECKERLPGTSRNARRLSNYEFTQTVKEVFGTNAVQFAQGQFQRLPTDTDSRKFFDTEMPKSLSDSIIDAYQVIGEAIGGYFIQGNGQRAELSSCLNNTTPDLSTCITPWITTLGEKAFRRPLNENELVDYLTLYSANLSHSRDDAIQMVVAAMIQSPFFVHHLEIDLAGESKVWPDIYYLNQYELASRLSYALWGSLPDETLMDAAKNGQLASEEKLKEQASRMIHDPKARDYTKHFLKQYFGTGQITNPNQSLDFLQGLSTAGLSDAAAIEIENFAITLFDDNSPYKDFFLSRKTFLDPALPGSATLKTIYGAGSLGASLLPPERTGILTRAANLFETGNHASPIHRGIAIRRYILCEEPPPPPPEAALTPLIVDPNLNTNDRAHAITSKGGCFTCHARINPPGYLLTAFDPIGRFRTEERIFDANDTNGRFVQTVPFRLNYSPAIQYSDEAPVDGPTGLSQALAESEVPLKCFSKRRYTFMEGRKPKESDKCVVTDISQKFKSGGVQDLISGIITPEFLLRKVEE